MEHNPSMRIKILILPLFLSLFCTTPIHASETDGFTVRYDSFDDGVAAVDREVNRRISSVVENANSLSPQCSTHALESAFKTFFLRRLYGKIEGYINSSPLVPKKTIPLSESIYKYLNPISNLPAHLWTMGFGSMIHAHDGENLLIIGADKFGHFFDQGFQYYKILLNQNNSLRDAFALGNRSEVGLFGLRTTGVKSFGDLVANYQGMRFWSNMLIPITSDATPYLNCVQTSTTESHWEIVRPFTSLEYIDAGWDEGVNCNQYRNKEYADTVNAAIQELKEKQPGKRFDCPVLPGACAALAKKYGPLATHLLHPKCLAENK